MSKHNKWFLSYKEPDAKVAAKVGRDPLIQFITYVYMLFYHAIFYCSIFVLISTSCHNLTTIFQFFCMSCNYLSSVIHTLFICKIALTKCPIFEPQMDNPLIYNGQTYQNYLHLLFRLLFWHFCCTLF